MTETILDRLARQAEQRGDHPALLDPRSDRFDAWDTLTWRDYHQQVRRVARGFMALGHEKGAGVGIIGPNRTAWVVADLAAMAAGGMPAGIYATSTPEQVEYILADCRARVVVVVDTKQAEKVLSRRAQLPLLRAVVLFPGATKSDLPDVYSWEQLLAKAEEVPETRLDEIRSSTKPDDLATLIYTSGTTGPPKGVMLSHHNLTWTAEAAAKLVALAPGDRCVSYLPLAHIAEQMLTIHGPITFGAVVHFVPVMEQLPAALPQVRPNFIFGVPRVWEKIQAKVDAAVVTAPPVRQKLFAAAQKVGLACYTARYEGRSAPFPASLLLPLFEKLVFSKFRARIGLDQSRIQVSGAAPLSPATRDWFLAMGTPLSEVYGQSEDSGPTSLNVAGRGRLGTVGQPVPGVQVKIAPDGEILVKGPNVFLGYLNQPGATQEAVVDGWLHSGDVGELDADNFLKITDRKKDLLITAGGKNIAPQNLEQKLREIPLVSQAVVIGDRKKYLVALLSLKPEALESFCAANGITEADPARRTLHPKLRATIQDAIEQTVNPRLARYETIKNFFILPQELSEAAGELTPTMKIKRKVVNERYAAEIAAMYQGEGD